MTAVFVCSCGRAQGSAWLEKVVATVEAKHVHGHENLCRAEGLKLIRGKTAKAKPEKLLLAGCAALGTAAYGKAAAEAAGIAQADVAFLPLPRKASAAAAARTVRLALAGLELTPDFDTRAVALHQDVLVVGQGPAADEAARQLQGLGRRAVKAAAADLGRLEGAVGSFRTAGGTFGAVIVAAGLEPRDRSRAPFVPGKVVPLEELEGSMALLHRRDRPRSVAILLDLEIDDTRASWAEAVRTALALRAAYKTQVTILQRDVRVSGRGLEAFYDQARDAGVVFLKFEGTPRVSASKDAVTIGCRDSVAGEDIELSAGLAAASAGGLSSPAERGLAEAADLLVDGYGRLQENNIHLLPDGTNRTGVFVVGPCRGEQGREAALRDARAAALAAHALLSQKKLAVELSHPVVDPDKCVLCLTCIRSCPFKAMRIFMEEKRADSIPEACRRCGICAGECPAKAITLPAHSDAIVMARAGVSAAASPAGASA